jgi:hypothetical protein
VPSTRRQLIAPADALNVAKVLAEFVQNYEHRIGAEQLLDCIGIWRNALFVGLRTTM